MKPRRWLTWGVFVICAIALLEALAWLTWQAIRLEEGERSARAEAEFQETIRLAMWRLESEITPLLAQEAGRPYFQYLPFYPAGRQYTHMLQPLMPGDVPVASQLLEGAGPYIKLYFQLEPDGRLSSPQAPAGTMRELAESRYVDPEFLVLASERLSELNAMVAGGFVFAKPLPNRQVEAEQGQTAGGLLPQESQKRTAQEYAARQQAAQTANAMPEPRGQRFSLEPPRMDSRAEEYESGAPAADFRSVRELATDVRQGSFEAIWVRNPVSGEQELLLHRRVEVGGMTLRQGMWVDWPALRERLRTVVVDLLPEADLAPGLRQVLERSPASHLMATIPVLLAPGSVPPHVESGVSPMKFTFVVTWLAVLAAMAAIAVVLRKSMELSDRRGRFVSAVTHELRTPLTTFCMYTEMLAEGMVRDEDARQGYLLTLKGESRRLAGIVENVLEYARLGGKKPLPSGPPIMARDLVARAEPSLVRCAERCDMKLVAEGVIDSSLRVTADTQTVERILLNLVDNSCKYAAEARDRRLHLVRGTAVVNGRTFVELRVRDHGPGIATSDIKRIFRPFSRGRREANGSKGGLGLGLALSRGLARELGGDLFCTVPSGGGAEFILRLPT